MNDPNPALLYEQVTAGQRRAWSAGDFNQIGRQLIAISDDLVRAADPRPGHRVLDVACGSGNTALIAARRYCEVVGIDFAPNLIERARDRAAADGVEAEFHEADAQKLPFPAASFDAVFSVMGVMFCPDQERAAEELLRVCRPGGTIALAAWPPDGSIADFFAVHAEFGEDPPEGMQSPFRWGTADGIEELLGAGIDDLRLERRTVRMYYRSPQHATDVLRRFFGPTIMTLESLDPVDAGRLEQALLDYHVRSNRATDGTMEDEVEYVLAIANRA
jgi:ubiquinone/menaquinone biosynthesis C-methylase UbiE